MQTLQKAANYFVVNKTYNKDIIKWSNLLQINDREPQFEKELSAKGKQ